MVVDVLVVGGGVIGVATANACAQRGLRVALCERHGLASAASGRNAGLVVGPHPARAGAHRPPQRRALAVAAPLRPAAASALDRMSLGYLVVAEDAEALDASRRSCRAPSGWTPRRCASSSRQLADDLAGGALVDDCRRIDPAGAVAALAEEARRFGVRDPDGLRGQGADPAPRRRRRHGRGHGRRRDRRGHGRRRRRAVVVARVPLARATTCRCAASAAGSRPPARRRSACAIPSRTTADVWHQLLGGLRTTVGDLAAGAAPPIHPRARWCTRTPRAAWCSGASLMAATGDRDEGDEALAGVARRAVRLVPGAGRRRDRRDALVRAPDRRRTACRCTGPCPASIASCWPCGHGAVRHHLGRRGGGGGRRGRSRRAPGTRRSCRRGSRPTADAV